MKKLIIVLGVVIAIFYMGCEETTDPGDDNGAQAVTKIEGKLPNWTLGTNKTIKFFVEDETINASFGEATIAADGSFSITLQTPSASQLSSLIEQDSNCTGNQTINPSDTKGLGGGASFQIYEGTNIIGNARLTKRLSDTSSSVGDADAIWVYLSKDATMNGTQTCTYNEGTHTRTFTMSMTNLKGKFGWNKYYMTRTVSNSTADGFTLSSTEPSGLAWHVDIWGGSSGATISGTLPNWTYGSGKTIKYGEEENGIFYSVGEGTVNSNGSFTIELQTPASSKLSPIFQNDSSCNFSGTVVPSDVKVYGGDGDFYIFDGTSHFGKAHYAKMSNDTSESVGDVFAAWVYLDKNCTINGSEVCVENDGGIMRTHTTNFSNLNGVAGWNKMYVKFDAKTSTSETLSVSTTEPSGLVWKFWKY